MQEKKKKKKKSLRDAGTYLGQSTANERVLRVICNNLKLHKKVYLDQILHTGKKPPRYQVLIVPGPDLQLLL